MIRRFLVSAAGAACLVSGAAFAADPAHEEALIQRCMADDNTRADCECALGVYESELTPSEYDFVMAASAADQNDPQAMMTIMTGSGLSMEDMAALGQKVMGLNSTMQEACGISPGDADSAG